jgi:hypothetical protein
MKKLRFFSDSMPILYQEDEFIYFDHLEFNDKTGHTLLYRKKENSDEFELIRIISPHVHIVIID